MNPREMVTTIASALAEIRVIGIALKLLPDLIVVQEYDELSERVHRIVGNLRRDAVDRARWRRFIGRRRRRRQTLAAELLRGLLLRRRGAEEIADIETEPGFLLGFRRRVGSRRRAERSL